MLNINLVNKCSVLVYISQLVRYPTIQSSDCKRDSKPVMWFDLWFDLVPLFLATHNSPSQTAWRQPRWCAVPSWCLVCASVKWPARHITLRPLVCDRSLFVARDPRIASDASSKSQLASIQLVCYTAVFSVVGMIWESRDDTKNGCVVDYNTAALIIIKRKWFTMWHEIFAWAFIFADWRFLCFAGTNFCD